MKDIISIGVLVIFIGFILIFIGALTQANKTDSKVAVAGFIGFIPFFWWKDIDPKLKILSVISLLLGISALIYCLKKLQFI